MAQVKVYHDRVGQTLTVWFGDPEAEHVCEETGDEVVLMKDKQAVLLVSRSSTLLSATQSNGTWLSRPLRADAAGMS
jgi:hypothetical protein